MGRECARLLSFSALLGKTKQNKTHKQTNTHTHTHTHTHTQAVTQIIKLQIPFQSHRMMNFILFFLPKTMESNIKLHINEIILT